MDLPMEPLQRLPKQPLKSPTGARLVLCKSDAGYPDRADSSSPARGKWFDNIVGTDAKLFLQVGSDHTDYRKRHPEWECPAVVLMPEEYNLRVGGMSVKELRSQLEEYWGRGGVPGAAVDDDYQDMWVPAWAPFGDQNPYNLSWLGSLSSGPPIDPIVFSRWANGECAKWLGYFIGKNHTLGVVHAWFAAFLGVTRFSLSEIAGSLRGTSWVQDPESAAAAISHLKLRMSFDVCMEGYDEAVDGIPSLPSNAATTIIKGVQVITDMVPYMYPRRIWDICANTVIPATWFCGRCPFTNRLSSGPMGVRPVSHAWVADGDLTFIMTAANQQLWPIPLPRGIQLEDVRQEMIRLGVRYAWLDVLCLRQQAQPALAKNLATPVSRELVEKREQHRLKEWKTDVPSIGAIYSNPDQHGIYGTGPTVIFMNGLGRPFRGEGWASERHWLRRAWTLQETPPLNRCLIAGLPEGVDYRWNDSRSKNLWPWNCEVGDDGQPLHSAMNSAASCIDMGPSISRRIEVPNLDTLLRSMLGRHSSNPIDKVCSITFPFQRGGSAPFVNVTFPIYDPSTPVSVAWGQLISIIASADMHYEYRRKAPDRTSHTPTIQLLRLFPHPSRHHWFPSWTQVQQYPDVSVRDNDPGPVTKGMEYSLQIVSGRIYRGCSLRLTQPPTPEKQAIYFCTKDDKSVQLMATVPGIELHIDPATKYVLVDISPDNSLWPAHQMCQKTNVGHEHLPIWQESVVLVCEEADTPSQPTEGSLKIMKYNLRRVTTLAYETGPGNWLPFEPSLVHIRSIVCSARGASFTATLTPSPNVFCDPAVDTGVLKQKGKAIGSPFSLEKRKLTKWRGRFPMYEVYLV